MTGVLSRYTNKEYLHAPHSACAGCTVPMAIRYFFKAAGEKLVFVVPAGCASVIVSNPKRTLSYDGQLIRVLCCPFGSAVTFAAGLKSGLTLKDETDMEVVVWAGDGATFDIGLGALSGAAERNEDIIYVCYDNEAYQNTGNQKSSASPWASINTTNPVGMPKVEAKKDIMSILMAHCIPYLATATVAYPEDFMKKVRKAMDIKGFRFFHVLTPCPTGWQFPTRLSIEVSRLAVQTKIFPLFEVENSTNVMINEELSKDVPIEEYVKLQGRYRNLSHKQMEELENQVQEKWRRLLWLAGY